MKVLVIGSGGREHALAWRLKQSSSVSEVLVSPGNCGTSRIARNVPNPDSVEGLADVAEAEGVALTVVGPEVPLVGGIVDRFRAKDLAIVGPSAAAAQLEGSKLFAKRFLERTSIPTAERYGSRSECRYPVVVKADGLAAGKGVAIAYDQSELEFYTARFGSNVLYEEFLEGEEVSFICLSNGQDLVALPPSQDHKRAFDGDQGPNTGGMGAYCDRSILPGEQISQLMETVMYPAIRQMALDSTPFTGFLYAGLMMTGEGPKVLEFNVRLGDPEAEVLLRSMDGDLADLLEAAARGGTMVEPGWRAPSACVVLASGGYPEHFETGRPITGLESYQGSTHVEGTVVFHAGTRCKDDGVVTAGGRVLVVSAMGKSLPEAVGSAYRSVQRIHFDGMQYRRDIGHRGLARWNSTVDKLANAGT